MLTVLFIVGRTTLFTPVDINLQQVVDFLNFYACSTTNSHFPADFRRKIVLPFSHAELAILCKMSADNTSHWENFPKFDRVNEEIGLELKLEFEIVLEWI
jgi:nickel-dependent lactate racemase